MYDHIITVIWGLNALIGRQKYIFAAKADLCKINNLVSGGTEIATSVYLGRTVS